MSCCLWFASNGIPESRAEIETEPGTKHNKNGTVNRTGPESELKKQKVGKKMKQKLSRCKQTPHHKRNGNRLGPRNRTRTRTEHEMEQEQNQSWKQKYIGKGEQTRTGPRNRRQPETKQKQAKQYGTLMNRTRITAWQERNGNRPRSRSGKDNKAVPSSRPWCS